MNTEQELPADRLKRIRSHIGQSIMREIDDVTLSTNDALWLHSAARRSSDEQAEVVEFHVTDEKNGVYYTAHARARTSPAVAAGGVTEAQVEKAIDRALAATVHGITIGWAIAPETPAAPLSRTPPMQSDDRGLVERLRTIVTCGCDEDVAGQIGREAAAAIERLVAEARQAALGEDVANALLQRSRDHVDKLKEALSDIDLASSGSFNDGEAKRTLAAINIRARQALGEP